MANAQVFSPNLLGKRSSHFDNDEEMTFDDPAQAFPHSGVKKFKLASRTSGELFHQNQQQSMNGDEFNGPPSKLARKSDENSLNQSAMLTSFNSEILELKYQNSQLSTRMHQAEMALQKKDQEFSDQKVFNQRVLEELQKRTVERDTLLEENRILKKGIALQENKLREMNQQIQQYEQFVTAAKAYIEETEKEKLMKAQAANISMSRSNYFPPQPPPDVF